MSTELEPTPYLLKIMEEVEKDIAETADSQSLDTSEDVIMHLDSL